jgi:hypothetical protein
MATTFGVTHFFAGGTQEQYQNAIKVVHPPGGLPPGQTIHVGANTADGFLVIALFDSEDSWVKFRDETLLPGLGSAENAFSSPPVETTFEIVNLETA